MPRRVGTSRPSPQAWCPTTRRLGTTILEMGQMWACGLATLWARVGFKLGGPANQRLSPRCGQGSGGLGPRHAPDAPDSASRNRPAVWSRVRRGASTGFRSHRDQTRPQAAQPRDRAHIACRTTQRRPRTPSRLAPEKQRPRDDERNGGRKEGHRTAGGTRRSITAASWGPVGQRQVRCRHLAHGTTPAWSRPKLGRQCGVPRSASRGRQPSMTPPKAKPIAPGRRVLRS